MSGMSKFWAMEPMITDRRHFFLLEGSDIPVEQIVERLCENGYHKTRSDESNAIYHLIKDDGVVSLYELGEEGASQLVAGTIMPDADKLEQARKIQHMIDILSVAIVLYVIFAIALHVLPIVTFLLGWLDFVDIVGPIIPLSRIGFIVFAVILLIPVSYSSWILPVHNRKVAKSILDELVLIVKDACPSLELQSTEIERLNWPDFRINQGIPEDILLKLQTIGNAFAEFGNLETRLDCVKAPL